MVASTTRTIILNLLKFESNPPEKELYKDIMNLLFVLPGHQIEVETVCSKTIPTKRKSKSTGTPKSARFTHQHNFIKNRTDPTTFNLYLSAFYHLLFKIIFIKLC